MRSASSPISWPDNRSPTYPHLSGRAVRARASVSCSLISSCTRYSGLPVLATSYFQEPTWDTLFAVRIPADYCLHTPGQNSVWGVLVSWEGTTAMSTDAMRPIGATADRATARLGPSLHVKGEITGNEDLVIEGTV